MSDPTQQPSQDPVTSGEAATKPVEETVEGSGEQKYKIQVGRTGPASEDAGSGPSHASSGGDGGPRKPRGDRKERRPRENRPPAETLVVQHVVPPPSRRDRLSQELEDEINAALGDLSIDQVISGSAPSTIGQGLELDSRIRANVVRVHGDNVFFALTGRNEGVASVRQFSSPPEPGAFVDVVVKSYNADDGLYEVGVPGASVSVGDWSDISDGVVVEARVTAANAGGLECMVNNIRGFIPASQVAMYRIENLSDYVDQKLRCVVTEANPNRRNLVLSHRAVLEREKEEARGKLLAELEPGQIREGTVRSLRDFGAFVDLGGVDGLIHISQLSWDRVKHPSEVLQEGQKVRVKVEKIDSETGKIGLSLRDLQEHPWHDIQTRFPTGSIVQGVVSRLAKFGAFVKLAPGIEGLVHLSEISHQRVRVLSALVKEGQEVEVKILSVDPENQRIGLSLKATAPVPEAVTKEEPEVPVREPVIGRRNEPLKGGTDRPSGGDQFGLSW